MCLQVFEPRPTEQVVAEHFVRSLGRSLAGDRQDHDASNDCHVKLNGDSLGLPAKQVSASKELLDYSEVQLDSPPKRVQSRDDLGRRVEIVCDNAKIAITAGTTLGVFRFAAVVRLDFDNDDSCGMVWWNGSAVGSSKMN